MSDFAKIQRVVFPDDRHAAALYFHAVASDNSGRPLADSEQPNWQRRSMLVPPQVTLSLETLFNHLPEAYWLHYTKASGFCFSALVSGAGEVQLLRKTRAGDDLLLTSQSFDTTEAGVEAAMVELTAEAPADRMQGAGVLFVRLVAGSQALVLGEAEWTALGVVAAPVRLVAGYCTFHREVQLLANVQSLLADAEVCTGLEALVVVDQGESDTLTTAMTCLKSGRDKVHLVHQGNFGGSGGFARVMMEALGMEAATHVLLMDDDAKIETESVFRTLQFLSLTDNLAVGGQMLDLCLPTVLLESGARVERQSLGLELIDIFTMANQPQSLRKFTRVNRIDYNAWWFFATPLAVVRRLGLPMPMFIRGDDIEYGLRLKANDVSTVTLPGVALWHEPFYLKRGWQSYYDMRNTFVLASVWLDLRGVKAAWIFLRRVLDMLFRYDYGFAALTCRGIEDWLRGPGILYDDPRPRHEAIKSLLIKHQMPEVKPTLVTEDSGLVVEARPRGLALIRRALSVLVRNLFGRERPPQDPAHWIPGELENWWTLARYDDIAIRPITIARLAGQKGDWRRLHRSPHLLRLLLSRSLVLSLRLMLSGTKVAARWRAAAPDLRGEEAWTRMLAGPRPAPTEISAQPLAAITLAEA